RVVHVEADDGRDRHRRRRLVVLAQGADQDDGGQRDQDEDDDDGGLPTPVEAGVAADRPDRPPGGRSQGRARLHPGGRAHHGGGRPRDDRGGGGVGQRGRGD